MGNKKLVICCIVGILLGFIVPFIFKTDRHVTLMVGMVGGLAIGLLLDEIDKKKDELREIEEAPEELIEKASEAQRLLEDARARLEDGTKSRSRKPTENSRKPTARHKQPAETPDTDSSDDPLQTLPIENEFEQELAEESRKLSEAEALLRSARDRMKSK